MPKKTFKKIIKKPKKKAQKKVKKIANPIVLVRPEQNPIISPRPENGWEAWQTFNPGVILLDGKIHFLYRAIGEDGISRLGYSVSSDGFTVDERLPYPVYEHKTIKRVFNIYSYFSGGSWGGAEDSRLVRVDEEDVLYMTYTACDNGLRVGLTSIKVDSFLNKKWKWKSPALISPPGEVHKNWLIFPEKINGKYAILHSIKPNIQIEYVDSLEFDNTDYINSFHGGGPRKKCWDKWLRGAGAPPLKTKEGWLLFYSYIKNYFLPKPIFGVEAVLLDIKNPLKVIARTKAPLLSPEEYYERIGLVPNVIFPTGALLEKNLIHLYYGAADTICCLATIDMKILLIKLLKSGKSVKLGRAKENPIIIPNPKHLWESKATFNPGAIYLDGKVHLIYRAMSEDNTSVFGYTTSQDGIHIDYRSPKPVYVPREHFEQKQEPGRNSGCEDPRLTKIGSKIYMLYTAFDGKNPPRIALTWILAKDFVKQKWVWANPVLISPPDIDDKDACIFPEKIDNNYFIIHRSGDDIDLAFSPTLNFDGKTWIEEYRWIVPRAGMWDSKKVGIVAPPIKTKEGWIMFYHGVSDEDGFYRIGACLLNSKDPKQVIARSDEPIFEPETDYEKVGQISNVVFPCGAVLLDNKFFLYYGGADKVVGVATIDREELLKNLELWRC